MVPDTFRKPLGSTRVQLKWDNEPYIQLEMLPQHFTPIGFFEMKTMCTRNGLSPSSHCNIVWGWTCFCTGGSALHLLRMHAVDCAQNEVVYPRGFPSFCFARFMLMCVLDEMHLATYNVQCIQVASTITQHVLRHHHTNYPFKGSLVKPRSLWAKTLVACPFAETPPMTATCKSKARTPSLNPHLIQSHELLKRQTLCQRILI